MKNSQGKKTKTHQTLNEAKTKPLKIGILVKIKSEFVQIKLYDCRWLFSFSEQMDRHFKEIQWFGIWTRADCGLWQAKSHFNPRKNQKLLHKDTINKVCLFVHKKFVYLLFSTLNSYTRSTLIHSFILIRKKNMNDVHKQQQISFHGHTIHTFIYLYQCEWPMLMIYLLRLSDQNAIEAIYLPFRLALIHIDSSYPMRMQIDFFLFSIRSISIHLCVWFILLKLINANLWICMNAQNELHITKKNFEMLFENSIAFLFIFYCVFFRKYSVESFYKLLFSTSDFLFWRKWNDFIKHTVWMAETVKKRVKIQKH